MIKNPSKIPLSNAPKIAIVKLSALGDIVHAAVVLQFIKKHLPSAQITWIADEKFSEILSLCPQISRVISLPLKSRKYKKSLKLIASAQQLGKFDVVIDLQGLIKSAMVARLLGKNVFGFDKFSVKEKLAAKFYAHKFNCDYGENVILRNLGLAAFALNFSFTRDEILAKSPCFVSSDSPRPASLRCETTSGNLSEQNLEGDSAGGEFDGGDDDAQAKIDGSRDETDEAQSSENERADGEKFETQAKIRQVQNPQNVAPKRILIAPFASEPSKIYDKFADVANLLKEYEILLCWAGEKEYQKARQIAENSHARLLPKLNLRQLVNVIERCDLVIGNDSGVTHLAWAQNRPSITLFGNRSAERNAFASPINLTLGAGKKIDARKIDKNDFCVRDIAPQAVANAAKRLLDA